MADREGREGAVKVHQDVSIYATMLTGGSEVTHTIAPGRQIWVQVVQGHVNINDTDLREGDGAAVTDLTAITLSSQAGAEVLVFDLAA